LRKLNGDDEKRAKELGAQIDQSLKSDHWEAAIAKAEEMLALRAKVQGPKHFETVNAEWRLKALRQVAPMPKEDRVAYQSASTMNEQALALNAQAKYAQAQPLFEKALAIRRRLLTDDHPDTAESYNELAQNLEGQGKHAEAQPLYERALAVRRGLLTDDHPDTAAGYNNLAHLLWVEGKYTAAQPLFEKALAIHRRLLTDDHPDTAQSYNNLACNLDGQRKYAAAQPLYEKALAIRRRLFTDDHAETAQSYANLGIHLDAQAKYSAAQPFLEKALEIRRRLLSDEHRETAQSYDNLGYNLNAQAKHAAAQRLFEKALEIRRRLLSDDHRDTAACYNNLAHNLNAQGKYGEAQPLFEKALAIRRRLLTDDHPDTAASYEGVADNLNVLGKYAEAARLCEKALQIRRKLLTDDHPDTARSYHNVAANLSALGKYAQAQPLYEKALAINRRLLTDEHPYTAHTYSGLALNLTAQGKYGQAQPLYEKALAIRRRLLTDNHPVTAQSYDDLAANLNAQGKYAQAQPLHEKALAIRRRLLAEDHPDTAASYNNAASNLNAQGKYAQAQRLFEKALAIPHRLLGDDHPNTAASYNSLAYNLDDQGKYAAAQPLLEKALAIYRRLLTDDHPLTAGAYNNLAHNLNAQGKYAVAQPLYEKALAIRRRLLTDDHPDTAVAYGNVAGNLDAQGKHAQAQPLYEEALAISRRLLGDDHLQTARSYNNVAMNLKAQGKHAAAQPLFERALAIKRRLLTDDHADTALGYNNLASNLDDQGKYAAAQRLYEKALEIRRRVQIDDLPDTAGSYNNLAGNLKDQGKYAAAQPLFEKALAICRRLLTDDHPRTAISYGNVAANLNAQGRYNEAKDRWLSAVKSLDAARLQLAFGGLDRSGDVRSMRPSLAAALTRLGQPAEAWQALEDDLGRGLLDELAARQDRRLSASERDQIRELAAELERLDKLAESIPRNLDQLERAKRFEELKRQRDQASIALGEFQTKLAHEYGALAGRVASMKEIQVALPADAALIAWVDIRPNGPNAADPDGEHWGVVVRSHGVPTWTAIAGTAPNGLWTKDDTELPARVRAELRNRPGARTADLRRLIEKLRTQRLEPLAKALGATADGLPPARRLIVLPSRAMAGIPVEVLLADDAIDRNERTSSAAILTRRASEGAATEPSAAIPTRRASEGDFPPGPSPARRVNMERREQSAPSTRAGEGDFPPGPSPANRGNMERRKQSAASTPTSEGTAPEPSTRTASYAPSATVFKYLREQPRPDRHAGLLALGDPQFERHDQSSDPEAPRDHGLLLNVVARGSNAANHGLKDGDVLLVYNGQTLTKKDDLKVVADGEKPIAVEVWRDGRSSRRELAPGKLGVVLDPRPAAVAIAEKRKFERLLVTARSGDENFAPLPGTRHEVEALARLFGSDDRRTKALLGTDASEPELDHLATSGDLHSFGFIHLATHGVIDEAIPQRSAVILTQTGLPDPLEQVVNHKPVFDGRLSVREIQRTWDLKAELVTLSACETALGRESGGEGFVGFTQALLMSGARSVCLSLWKVDDKATALLMTRFYQNVLGKRSDLSKAMPKAEALQEAKQWLRNLTVEQIEGELAGLERGEVRPLAREKGAPARKEAIALKANSRKPYDDPYYWAAFVLVGDPD
jgi:tetratricopeptide (TPR) repeat protein